jgi:3-deoxy-D-manno-octulosonate 8-phosphate phosphatase (KDO 8-P phosphatase)
MTSPSEASQYFHGQFITSPEVIAERLEHIKAFVFDWDGVFNDGAKDGNGASPFNEVDAMGTNLLRFNHHLRHSSQAIAAIISGERNPAANAFVKREHFHAAYGGIKYKAQALDHLCETFGVTEGEVAFVFDDVLDFSLAARCGLRIMVRRAANPLLIEWALKQGIVDYLTAADGTQYAVRETVELLTGLSGIYDETIRERAHFSERYQEYLVDRNLTEPRYFILKNSHITPHE